jgi:hypothetical protein
VDSTRLKVQACTEEIRELDQTVAGLNARLAPLLQQVQAMEQKRHRVVELQAVQERLKQDAAAIHAGLAEVFTGA